jgi:hypothetical protein
MTNRKIKLKAAAGGAGGSWHVLLQGLARLVNEARPEIEIEVVEGGGVMNHELVGSGELPMAILNPPMTVAAVSGKSPYSQPYPELRIGVANLTVNYLHFAVSSEMPIESFEEMCRGRHPINIPVDRVGTVDRMMFRLALEYYGVTEDDLESWGEQLMPAVNYNEQLALYSDGRANALWQFMGVPSPSMQEAHRIRPIRLLPFDDGLIAHLCSMGWASANLPAGAYDATDIPVPTIAMGTSLGFHASVSDDVVYSITSAICEKASAVHEIHPAAVDFDPQKAHRDGGTLLHPGAERYFREKGLV